MMTRSVAKKPSNRSDCLIRLCCLLMLGGFDLAPAQAQDIAARLPNEPILPPTLQEMPRVEGKVNDLNGLSGPLYSAGLFVAPTPADLDELVKAGSEGGTGIGGPSTLFTLDPFAHPDQMPVLAQAEKPKSPPPKAGDDSEAELEDVEVVGTRRSPPEKRETVTRYEIKRDQIEATGKSTASDVIKTLVPGFTANESLGGINNDQGVFLRGLDSRRFLVLIDGRPTTRPSNNRSIDLGRLGVTNIERIEVITGGAGLRYSADAIGGAINIITRLPSGKPQLELKAEAGSYGFSRYAVNYSGSNGLGGATREDRLKPGYFGYETNYERRSAYNNYYGTLYEEPVGIGILSNTSNSLASAYPPGTKPVTSSNGQLVYGQPVSFTKPFRSAYVFSDEYAAKFIFQPATEHTIRASFSERSSRTGDQFSNPNGSPSCVHYPDNFGLSLEDFAPAGQPGSIDNAIPLPPPGAPLEEGSRERRERKECNYLDPALASTAQANNFDSIKGRFDQAEDTLTASLAWDWRFTDTSKLSFLGSFASSFEDNPSSVGSRLVSSQLIDTQLNYTAEPIQNNSFNAGFEYTQARYNATPQLGAGGNQLAIPTVTGTGAQGDYFAVDVSKSSWAVYVTDQQRFFQDAVILDLGIRTTTDQFYGTFTTPGAGLRWNFGGPRNETFGLHGTWFQSFKAPSLSQLFGYAAYNAQQSTSSSGPPSYFPNPGLKPETGNSYDLGLDVRISPTALFRVSYFRTDITNGIVGNVFLNPKAENFDPNDPAQNSLSVNKLVFYTPEQAAKLQFDQCDTGFQPRVNGKSTCFGIISNYNSQSYLSTGWEFSLDWQITPQLQLIASHSIVDARPLGNARANTYPDLVSGENIPLGSGGVQGGYFYDYQSIDVPFNSSNVVLRYTTPSFRVALSGQFIGLRPRAYGANYNPAYNRWDFTFGVPLTETTTFTGGVFNLFNDRSILADSTTAIGGSPLQPPTTFRVGMEIKF